MGILMPPSVMLVVMADRADTSVGNLFMGAVFPSLILGMCYIGYLIVIGLWKPEHAPPALVESNKNPDDAGGDESIWPMVKRVIADVVPALLLIVAVLGSIIGGVATPTQAASIGALAAGLLAFAGPSWVPWSLRSLSAFLVLIMASRSSAALSSHGCRSRHELSSCPVVVC